MIALDPSWKAFWIGCRRRSTNPVRPGQDRVQCWSPWRSVSALPAAHGPRVIQATKVSWGSSLIPLLPRRQRFPSCLVVVVVTVGGHIDFSCGVAEIIKRSDGDRNGEFVSSIVSSSTQ
nr:hypothetical protein CFP56_28693 [Quercus suber]